MKKEKILIAFVAVLFISVAQFNASAQEIKQGNMLIGAGLGFGHTYGGGVTIGVNMEYSITDEIGVGGYIAYTRWRYGYGYLGSSYDYYYNFIDVGVRGSYHFSRLMRVRNKKFDPYAGAYLGYLGSSYSGDAGFYNDPYGSRLRTGVFAGARYYFSEHFAGYAEAGYGVSLLSFGVTFKI